MKGYEIYKRFEALTPDSQKDAIGYYLGGVGMHFEGFTTPHRDQAHAAYALNELETAIDYAEKRGFRDATA